MDAVEYYGEYLGHGQSKTAFELQCPGARFDGTVLKVAKTVDMEPSVFAQGSQHGLTTSILYENRGNDGSRRYHCWITERTIPLDQFLQYHGADKQRCSLAAFVCMLRASRSGLYLSDCHFFNFGVKLSENATEHLVVIIDAGSRGIHPGERWLKSTITQKCMSKFWQHCSAENALNEELKESGGKLVPTGRNACNGPKGNGKSPQLLPHLLFPATQFDELSLLQSAIGDWKLKKLVDTKSWRWLDA